MSLTTETKEDADTTEDVEDWSDDQLASWALKHATQGSIPERDWHRRQVSIWAVKVLRLSKDGAKILEEKDIDGEMFPLIKSAERLESFGISYGGSERLWAAVVKCKVLDGIITAEHAQKLLNPLVGTEDAKFEEMYYKVLDKRKSIDQYQKNISKASLMMSPAGKKAGRKFVNFSASKNIVDGDISCLSVEERTAMILLLKDQIKIHSDVSAAPTDTRAPLLDRHEAEVKAHEMFDANFTHHGDTEKNFHMFYSIGAGSGSGKTRVCHEMREWCDKFVKATPKIQGCVKIYIDFSTGDKLIDGESNGSLVLGLRMACKALYSCTAHQFSCTTTKHIDMRDVFDFDSTVAAIRYSQPDGLCAILLVIDEFNHVMDQNKALSREILTSIGHYMTGRAKQDNVVIFPVISGTVYGELQNIFTASQFGQHLISLPPLSQQSIEAIFSHCLPTHTKWLDYIPFKRLLYLMASTPRVLRAIIEKIGAFPPELPPTRESIQSLASVITSKLFATIAISNEHLQRAKGFKELLHFIFAGTSIRLLQNSMAKLVHQLEIQGVIYRHGTNHAPFLPYHQLIKANETYGTYHSTYSHALVPIGLLPTPGVQFTWQMFEKLDHALDPVRIQALRYAVGDMCMLPEVFGAMMNDTLMGLKLKLKTIECTQESEQFIKKHNKLTNMEGIKTEAHGVIRPLNFFNYSFLCHTGNPLVDGRLFFHTEDNQKVMIVKQMKHLEKPYQKVTTIPFQHVEKWYKQLQKCFENVAKEYRVIYLFITNKQITHIPTPMPNNLMLVDATVISTYYSPFVAQYAEMMAFRDEGEDFEVEPDEDDLFEFNDDDDLFTFNDNI